MSAWLDRFSHNSPSASPAPPRTYSPAPVPRSSITLARSRPGLPARSSSVSLVSENPLSSSAKPTQPSTLRNQLSSSPALRVRDPTDALADILGVPLRRPSTIGTTSDATYGNGSIQHSGEDVSFNGWSLEEFVEQDTHYSDHASLKHTYSETTVDVYEDEKNKFEDLHKQIRTCDDLLQSVEKYLSSFHADLAAVAAEIETLQNRSTNLNNKLENRRSVEKMLNPMITQVTLSPVVVRTISERPLDEVWIAALEDLNGRQKTLGSSEFLKDIKAMEELRPLVKDLSDKAVERTRDFFASQIKALRAPNMNAQINQQQYFLPIKPAYSFLAARQPQLGAEIAQAYTNTMRWYYSTNFTRYHTSLSKVRLHIIDAKALLGEDPIATPRTRNTASAMVNHDPFSLGRRIEPLRNPSSAALPSHAAEETKTMQHIETPFLAFNLALIDNASFEYNFATYFFTPSITVPNINRYFQTMFAPVFALGTQLAKVLIAASHDALGILLLVRLTQHFAFMLQRRKVPTLENYINGLSMLLWPRYQQLLDAHCESLRRLTNSLPTRVGATSGAAAAASALIGGSSNSTSSAAGAGVSGGQSTAPHPVTQRFAMFVAGILALSAEAGDNEPVSNSLVRLRIEYEAFLARLGQGFGSGEKGKRDRRRLELNNYALVLTVLGDVDGRLADETRGRFEELVRELEAAG